MKWIEPRCGRAALVALLATSSLSCATSLVRAPLHPIPDEPPTTGAPPELRGTEAAAAAVARQERLEIYRELVRVFFRPMRGQARWIDPQPLSHRRERMSDSLAVADPDWAAAIVDAVALRRVCVLDERDEECRGRPGGVLKFSAPYAVSARADTVMVFARYSPVDAGGDVARTSELEIEFRLARASGGWRILSKRAIGK